MIINYSFSDIKTDFSRGELPFPEMDYKRIWVQGMKISGVPDSQKGHRGEIFCYQRDSEAGPDGEMESGITLLIQFWTESNKATIIQCRIALPREAFSRITRASDPPYDYFIDLTGCILRDTTRVGTN